MLTFWSSRFLHSSRGMTLSWRACLFALCLAAHGISADAADLYVSTSGSDANPGTVDLPLLTPHRALELAAAGDTVYLRQGTYRIAASLEVRQAGLTIASFPGERAAIVAKTTDLANVTSVIVVYSSGVT